MSRTPITTQGMRRLRDEVQRLKSVERPAIIKAIAEARAHGDLKENAEFHAAKEQQSFIEGRIQHIEAALANAELIDPSKIKANGKAVFGAYVVVVRADAEDEEELRYQIVGEIESDISAGLISVNSPLARALIGKREGDIAEVQAPAGTVQYEIVEIRYSS